MRLASSIPAPLKLVGIGLLLAACAAPSTPAGFAASDTAEPLAPEAATATVAEPATEAPTAAPTEAPLPSLPDPGGYAWTLVAQGFNQPLLVTNAGDGSGRLFVIGQPGLIYVLENGQTLATPFLDIRSKVGSQGNEQGLLGLAFHPDYAQNGSFYVDYTDRTGDTVVARYQVSADPNVADAESEQVLLQVHQPYANHNGGNLVFGPDGTLYIGFGDGGSAGDPNGNGQSLNTYLGKLLRIDVDGGDPYGIPADNPFAGSDHGEIWAYGLRNPWRFAFDALTGDLYIGDVGQNQWEEVDYLPAGSPGGANFGWNLVEGNHDYAGQAPTGANYVGPVAEYDHSGRCSITGGVVYRGAALPAWQGVYLYGDFCSGEIYGLLNQGNGAWQNERLYDTSFQITSFGVDEQGEVYVVDRTGGIYRLQAK